MLKDMVRFIGGGEHFGFVDEVNPQRLKDLSLDKMPDATLRHNWNGDSIHDLGDQFRVAHPGDTTFDTDVCRDAFESHHRYCGHGAR